MGTVFLEWEEGGEDSVLRVGGGEWEEGVRTVFLEWEEGGEDSVLRVGGGGVGGGG